jgi:hypothetical protein
VSLISSNPWLKRVTAVLIAVLSIGALTIPSAPANARVFVGFGVGAPIGWGYYAPSPYYGYYGYPYYPAYHYGYPGFFVGGTFGPHHHRYHHWR